jgi:hypothetical protein
MVRARAAAAKIEARMKGAQRSGTLAAFDSEYRRRRLDAASRRRRFMTYAQAQARLRTALGKVAASGITAAGNRVRSGC